MSSNLLKDYRCTCGKLLFKGLLCQCVVEVKCRRCGIVTTWGLAESLECALVESDADARVANASGAIAEVLGHDREHLIGRPIGDVFPLLRDAPSPRAESAYQLKEMPLVLHDGQERLVDSCIVPTYADGAFAGYRVFSVAKPA